MKRTLSGLVAACTFALVLASVASAGYREAAPVEVVVYPATGTGMAYGSLGSTRSDGKTNSYLGCTISADAAGGVTGSCQASDGTDSGSCVLDPNNFDFHLMALRNMTPSSEVVFAWETRGGQKICTYFVVVESSMYAPLQ